MVNDKMVNANNTIFGWLFSVFRLLQMVILIYVVYDSSIVWTEIGSGGTFYVSQASWIELEERILDMYIC